MSGIELYPTKTALQKLLHNEAVFIGYNSMLDIVPCLVLIFRTAYGKKRCFINNRYISRNFKNEQNNQIITTSCISFYAVALTITE